MSDRLQHKVDETKSIADQLGVDLAEQPLVATFEMPLWSTGVTTREISELARSPGIAAGAPTSVLPARWLIPRYKPL